MSKKTDSTEQSVIKLPKVGGRPPRLTAQTVLFIADKVDAGLPLKYALALLERPLTVQEWEGQLSRASKLSLLYQKRFAENLEKRLGKINDATCRTLPSDCWLLERRMPEYFSTKAQTVNAQNALVLVGGEGFGADFLARAGNVARIAQKGRGRKQDPPPVIDV